MKKILIVIFALSSMVATAQKADTVNVKPIKSMNQNCKAKDGKGFLVMSGACFVIGSLFNYMALNSPEPKAVDYNSAEGYADAINRYQDKTKTRSNVGNAFYGAGGLSLIIGFSIHF